MAHNVLGCTNTGIVGSDPTRGMDVCLVFFCVMFLRVVTGTEINQSSIDGAFFFYLDYETIGTAATPGLLCQPRAIMKMIVESMMKCRLAGETEVLGENLPQRHFCPSQNPMCPPGFEPGPPRWEAGD
jgi:hypothetical protein